LQKLHAWEKTALFAVLLLPFARYMGVSAPVAMAVCAIFGVVMYMGARRIRCPDCANRVRIFAFGKWPLSFLWKPLVVDPRRYCHICGYDLAERPEVKVPPFKREPDHRHGDST